MSSLLRAAVVGGLLAATVAAALPLRAAEPVNVIYFIIDELGYFESSAAGHPHFRTPNIDRLAAEGVRFSRAYAGSSVCAPTRCSLLTGKHAGHMSVRVNGGGTPLRADEETIASVLKRAGYATGGYGKWGCGGRGSTGVPERHGFDDFLGYYDQVHAHTFYPAYLVRNSAEFPLAGNAGGRTGQTYSHYVIVEEAKRFLREHRDRPFFLYLPWTPPHGSHDIPETDPAWALYRDEPWPHDARAYAAMVNMVDRHVGEVLALVDELGLDEHTVVFFSGDNGGFDYFSSPEHPRGLHGPNVNPRTGEAFRGRKGTLYEGGLRVPFWVRWPGKIAGGRTSEHLCYFADVLPTIADLVGAETPAGTDGLSFAPELLGGRAQPRHEFLYWEIDQQTAVRLGDWKGVRPKRDAAWELYDLATDPGEQRDVAAAHADVVAQIDAIARREHTPAVEGTFADTALHERDRAAKFGPGLPPPQPRPASKRPKAAGPAAGR